ncbi:MAG: acyl carrier protein [Planctomycetota bacterium]|nr:acyl carrier protein [Planctomycetota bacterium]
MATHPTENEVRQFVVENFLYGQDDGAIQRDSSFVDNGVIDSTGVLELVAFLEKTYGIKVEDGEITPDNLDSISRVARYIEQKRASRVGGSCAG